MVLSLLDLAHIINIALYCGVYLGYAISQSLFEDLQYTLKTLKSPAL